MDGISLAVLDAITKAVFSHLLDRAEPKLRDWLRRDPAKLAFQRALIGAYTAFVRQYPEYTASFFDEQFLVGPAAFEFAKLLNRADHPDPAILAGLWQSRLQYSSNVNLTALVANFLRWLEAGVKTQRALDPVFDGIALERLHDMTAKSVDTLRTELECAVTEAKRYDVTVQGCQGIVIGNNAQVTNVFNNYYSAEYADLDEYYLQPDSVFQRVDIDNFTGREWLKAELDCLLNENDRGAFLLVGQAGVGKTGFMANLVRERRYLHFFAEQAPGEAGIVRALQSLGSQLVTRYRLEPYFQRGVLPQTLVGYSDFFDRLLRMASDKLTPGEKLVVVCDALDEAGAVPGGNVLALPAILPKGLYLVLSQRPSPVRLRVDPYPHTVELKSGNPENLADMQRYLEAVSARPAVACQLRAQGYNAREFTEAVLDRSGGIWMYVQYVVDEVEHGKRAPLDLKKVPWGLVGYYADYWSRWRERPDWDDLYAPLLATLAAVHETVTLPQIAQWASIQIDAYATQRLLSEDWRAFLFKEDATYRLYHASLRDFFVGSLDTHHLDSRDLCLIEEMAQRVRAAHERIADKYYGLLRDGRWRLLAEIDSGYGIRNLAWHLAQAGRWKDLHDLVAEDKGKGQVWAKARRASEGSYAGYLTDLELLWTRADELARTCSVSLASQVRYAFIKSTIHSLAENIPPDLLAALVEFKVPGWTQDVALEYARQIADEYRRCRVLFALVPHLSSDLVQQVLQEALAAVRYIQNPDSTAAMVELLAPVLPARFVPELFTTARNIETDAGRSRALVALAPYLSEDAISEALAIVEGIAQREERVEALVALSVRYKHGSSDTMLRDLFCEANSVRDRNRRARVLAILLPHLPAELKREALEAAFSTIGSCPRIEERAQVLSELAPLLPDDQESVELRKVLSEMERPHKGYDDTERALALLCEHIPAEMVSEVLPRIRQMANDRERTRALLALLPSMDTQSREQAAMEALAQTKHAWYDHESLHALTVLARHLKPDLRRKVLLEAFAETQRIWDQQERIFVLSLLVPYLSEEPRQNVIRRILGTHQSMMDEAPEVFASILTGLLAFVGPKLRDQLLNKALSSAACIHDEQTRLRVVAPLGRELTPKALRRALSSASRAVGTSSTFRLDESPDNQRAKMLKLFAPNLSASLMPEALNAANRIRDCASKSRALAALIPYLPKELLPQVLTDAGRIRDESWRAHVMAALGPFLPPELHPKALATVKHIRDGGARAQALVAFAPRLAPDLQLVALESALRIRHSYARARALAALVPYLPLVYAQQAMVHALAAARGLWSADAYTLSVLAPHLPPELLPQALAAAKSIESSYGRIVALTSLVPHLPQEQRQKTLHKALSIAQYTRKPHERALALTLLLPHQTPELHGGVWKEVLEALREALSKHTSYDLPQTIPAIVSGLPSELVTEVLDVLMTSGSEWGRVELITALIPHISVESVPVVLASLGSIRSEPYRAQLLAALVSRLPRESLPLAVVALDTIKDQGQVCANILVTLAPHLPSDLLSKALDVAQGITRPSYRALAVASLAPLWAADIDRKEGRKPDHWLEKLHSSGGKPRPRFLADLQVLLPAILPIDDGHAASEVARAILDIERWWP